jgi:hypothetical protein
MSKENKFLVQSIVQKLVMLLMRDYDLPMLEAFATVYNSELYELLLDAETGLYYQSPFYVYNYLKNEIQTGKIVGN